MRRSTMLLMTALLMACGGSQDVCHQTLSVDQDELAKIQSCGLQDPSKSAEIADLLDGGLASCEAELKSCTSSDLSAASSALSCEDSLTGTVKCDWFTEADAGADPSYQAYVDASNACAAKTDTISAACANSQ